jgi:RHS repeat-associated protein
MKRINTGSLSQLFCATFVAMGLLLSGHASAQDSQPLPPVKSWHINTGLQCDFSSPNTLYQSPWPGDTPRNALEQYVANLNVQCANRGGADYILSYTLNPCTPSISGLGYDMSQATGCTMNQIRTPKPTCTPAAYCTVVTAVISAPAPLKICFNSSQGPGNGSVTTSVAPETYVECMCPAGGTRYVDPTTGEVRCIPLVKRTEKPCDLCIAKAIQAGTGTNSQVEVDYAGRGAFPLTFGRQYRSTPTVRKWLSNFDKRIAYFSINGTATATLVRPEGSYSYSKPAGTWIPDGDVNYMLAGSNGQFTVYSPDGREVENYSSTNKLMEIRTRANTLLYSMTYSTPSTPPSIAPTLGLLIKVTDQFGHMLNMTYDTQSRLSTMTDPSGALYQYAYDSSGNLQSVTYPDSKVRTYLYNELSLTQGTNLPGVLTGIVDENGDRYANFGYNSSGLAVMSERAGNALRHTVSYSTEPTTTVTYVPDGSGVVKYAIQSSVAPSGLQVTDPLGQVRSYSMQSVVGNPRTTGSNVIGNGVSSSVPLSRTFDANGNVTSSTDFNNRTTTAIFDTTRNLETSRTEASGTPKARTITTQWHSYLRLPTQINEPGKRTTFSHDFGGNILTKTLTDTATSVSRSWNFTYNTYDQVLTANGPRTDVADVTTYTYYSCTTGYQCGQVQTITNALGQVTTFNTYNALGQPLTITDPNGVVTTLTYDARGRMLSRTITGEMTTFEYWPTGQLKKVTLPDNSFISYTYDAAHRLTQVQDSEGNKIVYTLDAMGNRTHEDMYDPSNTLTTTRSRVFSTLNRLSQELGAAGTPAVTTTFGYDNNGNPTTVSAPLGRNSANQYDELNRLKQVTDPLSGVTQYGYNALDQLISVTDPKTLATTYTYNALDDLMTQVSPDTGTSTNTYDSAGNLKTATDARNKTATYTYDVADRVTQVAFGDQTIAYGYDAGTNGKGRLTSASDANHSLSWAYDGQGRVLSKSQTASGVAKTVGYGYTNGLLTSMTTPSGQSITYGYTAGKLSSMTVNGTTLLNNVLYEPTGATRGWTWGNGSFAVRTFDLDGKLTQLDSAGLNTYGYDDAFRITGITDTVTAANSWSYGYDNNDRLTTATNSSITQGFTFDADGNRLTQTGTTNTTFAYPSTNNKLSSATGSLTKAYVYDAAGNTTGDGTITYTYNNRGRMTQANTTTYVYNALGQRIKKTNATTIYFVYDEAGHTLGEYDGAGAIVQEIIWFGDTPVATLRPNGGGGVDLFYVHSDHLNTPRKITRPSDNQLRWTYNPDPYGNGVPNENPQSLGAFAFNLRFPGQYFDSETGNHFNYFRDYDPSTGRYLESDPIGLRAGLNTFAYVKGNPISRFDMFGLHDTAEPGYVYPTWPTAPGTPIYNAFDRLFSDAIEGVKITAKAIKDVCTKDDTGDCEKERQQLEKGKQALLNWSFVGLTLPQRVAQAAEYNEQVRELNLLIALHNQKCPAHRVEPLVTIPLGGKPE